MSNASLFVSLFSKWPKTRRSRVYFWRIIGLLLGMVLGLRGLIHLNEIPTKTIDLDFDGYGMKTADVDLTVFLGRNTNLRERFDSTYKNAFKYSNTDGVTMDFEASDIAGSYLLFDDVLEGRAMFERCLPNKTSSLENVNAMLRLHMVTTDVNRRLRMFHVVSDFKPLSRIVTNEAIKDSLFVVGGAQTTRETKKRKETVVRDFITYHFYRDSAYVTGTGKDTGTHTSFLYNRSIWQASDISQAYVGIHLSSDLHQKFSSEMEDDLRGLSDYRRDSLNTTLSIDFGSPVTLSAMEPAPDSVSMTGLSFISPEKVQKIIRDGLVFHVTFDQNKNLQAVKLFGLTTLIAALFGILLNQIFKWVNFMIHKRRLEKRIKARREQESDAVPDSKNE